MLPAKLTIVAFLASMWCCSAFTARSAFKHSLACSDKNIELQCPKSHVIAVEEVRYGKANTLNCTALPTVATVFPVDQRCLRTIFTEWVGFICDGQQRCRLTKPNPRMFACDANDNFVQVKYMCTPQSPAMRTVVACDGQTAAITCAFGTAIEVTKATYGRFDENLCTKTPSDATSCSSPFAEDLVADRCDERTSCQIVANLSLGNGTHCDNLPKYLTVNYECV
ncbi:L-rhamnose-binding lectin CSL2-like [Nerophis ophidion]|uniref:L-rhamnose-binding lectin CSL2-like n=1 Tax=Nerophis ophidion TaxID=159077 RepID=UPI002ADFA056|nr:L-rhamnose-binding lectin CSL2-like [Nerophis ophidion]